MHADRRGYHRDDGSGGDGPLGRGVCAGAAFERETTEALSNDPIEQLDAKASAEGEKTLKEGPPVVIRRVKGGDVERVGAAILDQTKALEITLTLVIAGTGLGVWLSYTLYENMPENHQAPPALITKLKQHLTGAPDTRLIGSGYTAPTDETPTAHPRLTLASPTPLNHAMIDALGADAARFLNQPVQLEVTTQLVTTQTATPSIPPHSPLHTNLPTAGHPVSGGPIRTRPCGCIIPA